MYDPVKVQRMIGYTFRNQKLLKEALMHRSFATEHNIKFDNQRLEFLGDAVLQIILTEYIFKRYPDYSEGDLTKLRSALANQSSLAMLARHIDLGSALMLGRGEIETGGSSRESTLSDTMESLLGAILLDSDLNTARDILLKILQPVFPEPADLLRNLNPKGTLQEYTQRKYSCQPDYHLISVSGPDHNPLFEVEVRMRGRAIASAQASKRKTAEGLAAQEALNVLRKQEKFPEEPSDSEMDNKEDASQKEENEKKESLP